jgi:hypothetical protein
VLDAGGIAAADCKIADFDGNRRSAIACSGASTANVKLYRPVVDAVLRGRVVDAETGRPIASTVTVRTPDGKILTDHPSFRGGFRVEGEFRKSVPAGKLHVTVSRGFDYAPVEQTIETRDGETTDLKVSLRRRTPLRRLGWVTGDSHAHMAHGERTIEVDFPFAALTGRAEGLDYLSLAQHWNLPRVTPEALTVACRAVSTPDFTLSWNLEAPKNYWKGNAGQCIGHGWTLGMRGRTPDGRSAIDELLVMSAMDYESDKPPVPNFEIQSLIHSLGGIVSYTHAHRSWMGPWGGKGIYPARDSMFVSNLAAELPFDTVAGPTYDTIDILMRTHEREVNRKGLATWFMLLNHGYRIAATASSDATFDNPGGGIPGAVRNYTRVEGAPTLDRIAAAMKAGRNFVTSGPLILFRAGRHEVGDVVKAPAKLAGEIQAWPAGVRIELIRNGETIRTFDTSPARFEIDERDTAWYVARALGSNDTQVAITNPIYFESASYRAPASAVAHVRATVSGPTSGTVEVLEFIGRDPVIRKTVPFERGTIELDVPATARLRVRSPGYAPQTKSIFLDDPAILDSVLTMRSEHLADWATFEKTRDLLRNVRLTFTLAQSK